MSDSTKNYGFLTPGLSGAANITVQDGNWEKLDAELIKKVDKESGKGLSTNDFTDEEKQKLAMLFSQTLTPPTLTATAAEGVAIGADGWTGTGWFCTAADTKYTVLSDNYVDDSLIGFNRFCLRPASDSGEWQSWTPYIDLDGTAYEFYYVPGRGLYETLLPASTRTADQTVTAIRWENHPPATLYYGKASSIVGVYAPYCLNADSSSTEDNQKFWVRDAFEFRNNSMQLIYDDFIIICNIVQEAVSLDFSALDINDKIFALLTFDAKAYGKLNGASWQAVMNSIRGLIPQLEIYSIDNF
ncbi:MAG: hypothetical protein ACI4DY_00830 [Monoglobaceae bacterium]